MCISTSFTAPQDSDINGDRANEIGAKISSPSMIKHAHLQKCSGKKRLLL